MTGSTVLLLVVALLLLGTAWGLASVKRVGLAVLCFVAAALLFGILLLPEGWWVR